MKLPIGAALKAFREHAEMTQKTAAHETKLTVNYLSLLETGRRVPSFDTLETLAAAYYTTVSAVVILAEQLADAACVGDYKYG